MVKPLKLKNIQNPIREADKATQKQSSMAVPRDGHE